MTLLPRLALVTPYNLMSAVAEVNHSIAQELVDRGYDLTIFRAEVGDLSTMPQREPPHGVPVVSEYTAQDLSQYDSVIYTSGNNYRFHGRLIELMPQQVGMVILHDFYLRHFFHEASLIDPQGAGAITTQFGGPPPPAGADEAWYAEHAPMTEWPCTQASAAVVHAPHYFERVAAACPGPVVLAPLPKSRQVGLPPARKRKARSPLTLATIGHCNPNKRSEQVIQAVGASELLRGRVRYLILGPIEEARRRSLMALAEANGVSLIMTGWIDDESMAMMLESVDAIACLRWPLMEGASASAILAMRSQRPIIVSDAGFYSTLPDSVFKVPYGDEQPALTKVLEELYERPALGVKMGVEAASWAEATFTATHYVDSIEQVLHQSVGIRQAFEQGRWLTDLASYFELTADDDLLTRTSDSARDIISSMFRSTGDL